MGRKKSEYYKPRKDGRYYTLVGTGRYLEDGRPERIPLYASSSAELEEKVAELKYRLKTGQYAKPSEITMSEYADKFFNTFKSMKGVNTQAMYKLAIKHIKTAIGHIKVKDLTYSDCQNMITARYDHYETCNKIRMTMKQIQRMAIRDKIINTEFWDKDLINMPEQPPSQTRALYDLEKEALQKAVFEPMDQAFIYLLYGCGLRRGEALGLTAAAFDLKNHSLTVRKAIVFDNNNPVLKDAPKTKNGFRELHIPKSVYDPIRFWVMRRMADYAREHGKSLRALTAKEMDQIMIFTMRNGGLVSKSSYGKLWARILLQMNLAIMDDEEKESFLKLKRAERKDYDFQINDLSSKVFRHNYATILYYSGITLLKAVDLMGHKDTTMLQKVYAHLDEQKENADERLDEQVAL